MCVCLCVCASVCVGVCVSVLPFASPLVYDFACVGIKDKDGVDEDGAVISKRVLVTRVKRAENINKVLTEYLSNHIT